MKRVRRKLTIAMAFVALATTLVVPPARACPFCPDVGTPLSYELGQSAVVLLAEMSRVPTQEEIEKAPVNDPAPTLFRIVETLKGNNLLKGASKIEVVQTENEVKPGIFLLQGYPESDDAKKLFWGAPMPLSPEAAGYVREVAALPAEGVERMAYFLKRLHDKDKFVADDAFREFAQTPYAMVKQVALRAEPSQFAKWIEDPEVKSQDRRLYCVILASLSRPQDGELFHRLMLSDHKEHRDALDPLISGYLMVKGAEGMPEIEKRYVHNPQAPPPEVYAAVRALRFHGQEENAVPQPRIVEAFRGMLGQRQRAEMVIDDLARWKDWDSLEAVVKLFEENPGLDGYTVRTQVAGFLMACPLPKAKEIEKRLRKADAKPFEHAALMSQPVADVPPAKEDVIKQPSNEQVAAAAEAAAAKNRALASGATPVWPFAALALAVIAVVGWFTVKKS